MIAAARRLAALCAVAIMLAACGAEGPASMAGEEVSSATLSGTVIYRERIALPPDAVVTVRLEDTSRADAPSVVLAEQVMDTAGRSVPIAYTLEYDPAAIDPRMNYAVRAEIRDGAGQLLWISDTVHPALTRGAPADDIEIRLVTVPR